MEGSTQELQAKLLAYQQFMAKYIVKSQEEKIQAIKAAEAVAKKKYEEQLANLLPTANAAAAVVEPASNDATKLYMKRNLKVSEAAKVGKSRWGNMETKRVAEQVGSTCVPYYSLQVNGVVVNVPPEVADADHGLRADGGVGGPSLAERVAIGANGASAPTTPAVPVVPTAPLTQTTAPTLKNPFASRNQILYHERNEMVSAAAKAGKSRWGQLEVEKATHLASLPFSQVPAAAVPVPPEVADADHGLRADGGVGGPSLAERVAMGANGASAPTTPAVPVVPTASVTQTTAPTLKSPFVSRNQILYHERNEMVSAAAKAGKSRWGQLEVEKATHLASAEPPLPISQVPSAAVPVPPEVEEANDGLRADGGVGGPSLAERVNMGAELVQMMSHGGVTAGSHDVPSASNVSLYQRRNAYVSAAGQAGKSRWGEMEVEKAALLSKTSLTMTRNIAAANHGLQSAGGVVGSSLADRVNLGAELVQRLSHGGGSAGGSQELASPNEFLYQQRNAYVSAAGQAGKSRWGAMEVEKAALLSKTSLSAAKSATANVAAATHGLRSGGGVQGPSLANRVRVGGQRFSIN